MSTSTRAHVPPLARAFYTPFAEGLRYIRYRLAAAGSDRALFPDDALAALHELSQGALREIDRLAGAALRDAARRKKKLVDRDTVVRVGETLAHFD